MSEKTMVFGKVRRWSDGERLWAENDWIRMVYVVTDEPSKIGTIGLHGADQMCVEFIGPDTAQLWATPTPTYTAEGERR